MGEGISESGNPGRIARLADAVINQIAAGEVVERPASVLKELVENSLDADASRIEVLLKEGGREEITVVDDGAGILHEDLPLALERHTTSKITQAHDLEQLGTYGFRGEALSSISSVSDMELRSRTDTMASAYRIRCAFGRITEPPRPVSGPRGTSVSVRNLFGEVPARQKFLRTASTEFSHCSRIFKELALGTPEIAFYLHHNGRVIHRFTPGNRESRFEQCVRPGWEPLHVREESEAMVMDAYLSPPHQLQSRGEISLFCNGRVVRNRNVLAAIRKAYLDTLGPHHEPSGVVYLDIRADWVDMNVHPQKLEFRCLRQEVLFPWLRSAIRKAIGESTAMRSYTAPAARPQESGPAASELPKPPPLRETASPYRPSREESPSAPPPSPRAVQEALFTGAASPAPTPPRVFEESSPDLRSETLTAAVPSGPPPERPPPKAPAMTPAPEASPGALVRYLGQIKASYLVCEDDRGLVIVDQHALHEKMRYESLKDAFARGPVAVQRLLVPKVLRLADDLLPVLEERQALLEELGFEVEPFGEGDVAVKGFPSLLNETQVESVLVETLRNLREISGEIRESLDRELDPLFATMACHSVVRANQTLTPREAEHLLEGLDTLREGWTCPHGRPVCFRLDFKSIEKHFERI